jgi:hypothetical protein
MECPDCMGKELGPCLVPRCDFHEQAILMYLAVALDCDQPVIEAIFFASYARLGIRRGLGRIEAKWICRMSTFLFNKISTIFPKAEFSISQWVWVRPDTKWLPHFPRQSQFTWTISEWQIRLEFFGDHRLSVGATRYAAKMERKFELFNDGQYLRHSTERFLNRKIPYYGLDELIDRQLRRFKFVTRK